MRGAFGNLKSTYFHASAPASPSRPLVGLRQRRQHSHAASHLTIAARGVEAATVTASGGPNPPASAATTITGRRLGPSLGNAFLHCLAMAFTSKLPIGHHGRLPGASRSLPTPTLIPHNYTRSHHTSKRHFHL
eukprot:7384536-Prymnesium_polylepis.1